MDAEALVKQYRDLVDARLDALLPSPLAEPRILHEAMRYSALAPGKRLRPALCLATAEAFSKLTPAAIDAACSLEFVHVFSLIHDDLPAIDDDDVRRGVATCHRRFGEAIAILAGDALFSLGFEVLANAPGDAAACLACLKDLANATGSSGLVGGEVLDVLAEGQEVNQDFVQDIHDRKTGALIVAGCVIGARLGGASYRELETVRTAASQIGLAFQITDDILNEIATVEQLGKAAGSDRMRKKATYPALIGLENSKATAEALIGTAVRAIRDLNVDSQKLQVLSRYAVERLS